MKIAVDAMGGDHAPEAVVEGSLLAKTQCSADLVLIGNETQIRKVLGETKDTSSIEIVHTAETIGMGEAGPVAIRKKREASLSLAMRFLAENKADAVVSAGNTSAVVATAKHFVGLIPGLRRPALAVPIPTPTGKILLVDVGAHAEGGTLHLAQSAALARVYLKVSEGLNHPRVGLLNIGREPIKGIRTIQRAFALLKRSNLNFVGNIEPQDLFADRTDAAICDGFTGNLLLKMFESVSEMLLQFFERQMNEFGPGVREEWGMSLRRFHKAYNYQNVGGAALLGTRKTVVVAHGRSQAAAITNAICLAFRLVGERVYERVLGELERDHTLGDLKHQNTILMLEGLRSKWGFSQK